MKRICLMGAAVAGLFTAGITSAASAAPARTKTVTKTVSVTTTKLESKTSTVSATLSCKIVISTLIPKNDTTVLAGSATGYQSGSVDCPKSVGRGVTHDSFTQNDAGSLSGPIQMWFNTGSVYGTYKLDVRPNLGPPTSTSFASASYKGTVTVKGATGGLRGATGSGAMACTTADSAHFDCTAKVKVSQTVTVEVPVKVKRRIQVKVQVPIVTKTSKVTKK